MVGESIQAAVLRFLLKLVKIFDYIPFNKKFGDHVDYKKHPNTGDWNIPRSFADVRNTTLRIYLYCLKQSLEFERNSMLEDLKIPTLIVHGENDSIVPVHNSIFMSNKIKGSKLEIIPNTDHIVVLNNSKEILEILEREFSAASYL
jgi:pimeloyl-ACP methyl ester carboxylesterase